MSKKSHFIFLRTNKLDLRKLVAEKLPKDGTLAPKHVGAGTWQDSVLRCILLQGAICWFLKIWNVRKCPV
jgi:hypothetical protein